MYSFTLPRLIAHVSISLHKAQHAFRAALCDSFNTPDALAVLRDLVSRTNVYVNARGKALNVEALERVARWVGVMLKMFGLSEGQVDEIGWGEARAEGEGGNVSFLQIRCGKNIDEYVLTARGGPDAISSRNVWLPRRGPAGGDVKERKRAQGHTRALRQAAGQRPCPPWCCTR
jgi:hypothetical protein